MDELVELFERGGHPIIRLLVSGFWAGARTLGIMTYVSSSLAALWQLSLAELLLDRGRGRMAPWRQAARTPEE